MRRLSATESEWNGRGSWNERASPRMVRWCAGRPSILRPSKVTAPVSFCSVPQMQLTSVRLARAVRADQAEALARRDVEIDAVERDEAAEALADAVDLRAAARS